MEMIKKNTKYNFKGKLSYNQPGYSFEQNKARLQIYVHAIQDIEPFVHQWTFPYSLVKMVHCIYWGVTAYNFEKRTVKPVLSGHSNRTPKLVFNTNYRLMQVKSIAECSKGSILQYFWPSSSYHLSLRSLFCLFLSGRLRQVLLYSVLWKSISS